MFCMRGADMQSSLLMLNGMRTTIPDYEGTMEHALEYIAPGSKIYTCLGMETRCSRIVTFGFGCDAERMGRSNQGWELLYETARISGRSARCNAFHFREQRPYCSPLITLAHHLVE